MTELFGTGIEGGADGLESLCGESSTLAEITDFDVVRCFVGKQDIRRLEIAVDDLVAVEVGDGIGDFADEPPALAVIDVPAEALKSSSLPDTCLLYTSPSPRD